MELAICKSYLFYDSGKLQSLLEPSINVYATSQCLELHIHGYLPVIHATSDHPVHPCSLSYLVTAATY